jgi:S1-C subfamily serine protease
MKKAIALAVFIFGQMSAVAHAQQLLERYQALLSEQDHFNSSGQRISTAAGIIRQDRANFHRFGKRDQEDETDRFFSDSDNRATLENLLNRGRADPGVIARIVNGTPLVRVEVWRDNSGAYVTVTLISSNGAGEGSQAGNEGPPAASSDGASSSNEAKSEPKSESKSGTGFYVSTDGYLITNEHVINGCSVINIIGAARERITARVAAASKADDLALLKVDVRPSATAVFQESSRIAQGASVVAYGYPLAGLLASTGNVSTGLVTALSGLGDNPRQMQISAPVQPGNSGGPLIDTKGAVVGVVVSKLNAQAVAGITNDIPQNVNFAIKVSSLTDLLDANSVSYRRKALQSELTVEALTQQVKEYTVKIECD